MATFPFRGIGAGVAGTDFLADLAMAVCVYIPIKGGGLISRRRQTDNIELHAIMPAMETVTLYRPVGPAELKLIETSDWGEFPPRLPEQPIFYPVLNKELPKLTEN